MDSYRKLKQSELEILSKLLEPDFPGRDELVHQLPMTTAHEIDEDGGLSLKCQIHFPAAVKVRTPSEGEYVDADGTKVHILLHVVDGHMNELEIYKDDSSKITNPPVVQNLSLFAPYSEAGVYPDFWKSYSDS